MAGAAFLKQQEGPARKTPRIRNIPGETEGKPPISHSMALLLRDPYRFLSEISTASTALSGLGLIPSCAEGHGSLETLGDPELLCAARRGSQCRDTQGQRGLAVPSCPCRPGSVSVCVCNVLLQHTMALQERGTALPALPCAPPGCL